MTTLFNIKDTLTNKISYYHLIALMASLPFDMFYSHLIVVSYTLHTLIHLNKNNIKPVFTLRTLALQSIFLVTVLSSVYSINKPEAFNEWGKQITIFLFPILFCLSPFDIKKYRPQLLLAFSLVCTATIVYLYADAFITMKHYQLAYTRIFTSAFTNQNFTVPIKMHATFFSMQVMLALVCMVSTGVKEKAIYNKLFYFTCSAILTAGIIQLSSKSIFVVLLLIMNIAIPWFLLKGRARLKFALVSATFSVLAVIGIFQSGTFKERFVTELKLDMAKPVAGEIFDGRLARWGVTAGLIAKKPLNGYGAGSETGLLQEGFYNNKLYDSYLNKLNTHSEYLSITLKSGVIGLLICLATLAFGFNICFREKDLVFLTFMTLVATVSISENLLDVDKGIFFYAFFFTFFTFSNEKRKENVIREVSGPIVESRESLVLS